MDRGSCEKVGRWAVTEWRSLAGASQFWWFGGVTPGKFFENIGANLCNLVHLGTSGDQKLDGKDAFPSHF